MNFTLRQSGHHMTTLTIKHSIGFYELVDTLLYLQQYKKDGSIQSFKKIKTKKKVIETLKEHLFGYGCNIEFHDIEDFEEHREKAEENIRELFPFFKEVEK